jgi:hypothetical protein
MCKEKIGEKALICVLAEVLSPQKSLGPQIANPQITNSQITKNIVITNRKSANTFAEGPQI